MRRFLLLAAAVTTVSVCGAATAEPVVKTLGIADQRAVLIRPEQPKASVILMPGGDGKVDIGYDGAVGNMHDNLLVRTRFEYAERGLAVLVIDAKVDLKLAVDTMRRIKSPVTVIASDRGTLRAAQAIADGAQPDALVLISGILTEQSGEKENVAGILGTPTRLPATLVIEHRQDECEFSQPAGIVPFIKWSEGRASAAWLDGGHNGGALCGVLSHHGLAGLDARVVDASASFR